MKATVATAVVVPAPLVATHVYSPRLLAKTLIMVRVELPGVEVMVTSDELSIGSSSLSQDIVGVGVPDAMHCSVTDSPWPTLWFRGALVIVGATLSPEKERAG